MTINDDTTTTTINDDTTTTTTTTLSSKPVNGRRGLEGLGGGGVEGWGEG